MADNFIGKYTFKSIDNWDNLLRAIGATDEIIAAVGTITEGTMDISKNGNVYTINTVTPTISRENVFELGKEFNDQKMDGSLVKSVMVADGNKMTQTSQLEPGKELVMVRELMGNEIKQTFTCGSTVSTAIYVKQ